MLGEMLRPGLISTSSEMMPQPICSPASNDPPVSLVLPPPVIFPVNVPATRYSRDEIAVVSGATGSCVSLLPATSTCQPSGVSRIPGGPDGTAPSGGSGLVALTGTAGSGGGGGSACPRGAAATGIATQTDTSMANGFNIVVLAPLVGSESRRSNGSVATEHLMVGLPNGERTANSSRRVPIQWASAHCVVEYTVPHASSQFQDGQWTAIGYRSLGGRPPFGHLSRRP